jgi:hypothetical protein
MNLGEKSYLGGPGKVTRYMSLVNTKAGGDATDV